MSSEPLTVFIYEEEASLIRKWTLQYPNIETGGDLFGLWRSDTEVVIQAVLGPGKNCRRHTTSFFQDEEYLSNVGNFLTTERGLCNIGGWHSHHTMNLPEPSTGDTQTIWRHLPSPGRFLLLIASIGTTRDDPKVSMGFTLFTSDGDRKKLRKVNYKILEGESPIRANPLVRHKLNSGAETGPSEVKGQRRSQQPYSDVKETCEGGRYYVLARAPVYNDARRRRAHTPPVQALSMRFIRMDEGKERVEFYEERRSYVDDDDCCMIL